ncbi:unnamed protein product [Phaeothamnion confervicola]
MRYQFPRAFASLCIARLQSAQSPPLAMPLSLYLKECVGFAKAGCPGEEKVHVVTGNEAADADSICSALCLAYLESQLQEKQRWIPMTSIDRSDLALRRETVLLLRKAGIEKSCVPCRDDVPLEDLHSQGRIRMTLTDHNAISDGMASLASAEVEIVNHHEDRQEHPEVRGEARDIAFDSAGNDNGGAALVGSCCTLVVERFLRRAPHLLTADVAEILLGVIALDTADLSESAERATDRDRMAIMSLQEHCPAVDRKELFRTLNDAKFDPEFWASLTAADCLRYDYKQFDEPELYGSRFGSSAVLMRAEVLAAKRGVVDAAAALIRNRGLGLLLILTLTLTPEGPRRELLAVATSPRLIDALAAFWETDERGRRMEMHRGDLPAEVASADSPFGAGMAAYWEQGCVTASRKQVVPLIFHFYAQQQQEAAVGQGGEDRG